MSLKPTIFIPIEIKPREFVGKVLIAAEAANRGARVYLGTKPGVNLAASKVNGGVYLYKDMTLLSLMSKIKNWGHAFVVLDEEMGPADEDLELSYRTRFKEELAPYVDKVLLISRDHEEPLKKSSHLLHEKSVVTGWARTDLWRKELRVIYSDKVNLIKKKYGDFILISSDFGVTSEEKMNLFIADVINSDIPEKDKKMLIERWHQSFDAYKDFLKALKNILKENKNIPHIILRPHPADDQQAWHQEFEGFKNIDIIYQGDISEWLEASKGLIHRGCTTAVESVLLDKPTAFYNGSSSFIKDALPRQVSTIVNNQNELYSFMIQVKDGYKLSDSLRKCIDNKIYFPPGFSYQLIAKELLTLPLIPIEPVPFTLQERIQSILGGFIKNVKKNKKNEITSIAPTSQKIPGGIKAAEVDDILAKLKFSNLRASEVYKDVIKIESK